VSGRLSGTETKEGWRSETFEPAVHRLAVLLAGNARFFKRSRKKRGNEVKEGKEHCRAKIQAVTSCSPGVLHGLLLGRLLGLFLYFTG
jgi:hypothetical protein